jgi:hypothetical protein
LAERALARNDIPILNDLVVRFDCLFAIQQNHVMQHRMVHQSLSAIELL